MYQDSSQMSVGNKKLGFCFEKDAFGSRPNINCPLVVEQFP
jgi:hypothetical protein